MIDSEIRAALDAFAPPIPVEPHWSDVRRRAGIPERRTRSRRGLVLGIAVAVAAPTLAAGAYRLVQPSSPGPRAQATIDDRSLGVKATFNGHPSRGFTHPGAPKVVVAFTRDLAWTLDL